MNLINIDKQVANAVKALPNYNYMLGRTLMQPFKPSNSGSRALMNSIHVEHFMVLNNSETPIIQTGYETEFGEKSTSYVKSDHNYKIINKIYKFTFNQDHYFLILQNLDNGEYDYIERVTYKHNTESYGYLWNNNILDNYSVGDTIPVDTVLKTSIAYDEYGNKRNGVNLVTLYLACAQNLEDSVILSESAAMKLQTSLIKNTSIMINDNDVLLNLYGNDDYYKTFPDVGEKVKNGMFCAIRRVENRDILFSLSKQRQKDILLSDRPILIDGYVYDIDVYSNSPDNLKTSFYNSQLCKYYQEKINFCKQINDFVGQIAMNNKLTYNLSKLYSRCRDTILGKEYFKEHQFNNVILDVTVMQPLYMNNGDKLADRYGGKGVVSQILPDKLMPLLDNGIRVDKICNQSTCINRENIGQLHEQSVTFAGMRIIDHIRNNIANGQMTYCEAFSIWYKFVHLLDPSQAEYSLMYIDKNDEIQCQYFINSVLEDDGIILSLEPFTSGVSLDKIKEIYDTFPWIKPYKVMVPMEDSNGNIRYVSTKRNLIVGKIYNYRLKQYAEEKFSVTSLSATNLKNLNTRSRANKIYETRYTKTPIMFGFMESCDMAHIQMQYVIMNLMLYSNSPQARRLFEQLLIGNPYDLDIKLDYNSHNRSAEIIAALFKNMGIRLDFIKRLKEKKYLYKLDLYKLLPPEEMYKPKSNMLDIIGKDKAIDEWATNARAYMQQKQNKKYLYTIPLYRLLSDEEMRKPKSNIAEILRKCDEENGFNLEQESNIIIPKRD